jgi:hypothetical protein
MGILSMKRAPIALLAILTALILTGSGFAWADESAIRDEPAIGRPAIQSPALVPVDRNVKRLLFYAPGEHSVEVLSVFRLHLGRLMPLPWHSLRERLRPYVLGGRTSVRLPTSHGSWRSANLYEDSSTLHIGGGTELQISDALSLSVDAGEVLHNGSLSPLSHQRYNLGLTWGF